MTIQALSALYDLKCLILPGKTVDPAFLGYHTTAYTLWKSEWTRVFTAVGKLKSGDSLYSDDFLHHEKIICLFDGDHIVALILAGKFLLTHPPHRDHSYFSLYPSEILDQLVVSQHIHLATLGFLTVETTWRKRKLGHLLAEILIGLGVQSFAHSHATLLTAATRNDVRINEIFYLYGGHALRKNTIIHGIKSDIMAIAKSTITHHPDSAMAKIIQHLWQHRIDNTVVSPKVLETV